jgi:mono/diheme cytochrome c family protein
MDAKGAFAPEIRGMSSDRIKQAIGEVPEMEALAALSSSEIQAVADALPKRSDPLSPVVPAFANLDELDVAQLFATRCAPCHGVDATGGLGGVAPPIVGVATVIKINEAIGRVAMMAPLATLGDIEIRALGEFLTGSSPLAEPAAAKFDVALGKSFFAARCAACHGADAKGGLAGMAPEITGASAERIRQAISEVSMMAPLTSVTIEETEAVAAFLQ